MSGHTEVTSTGSAGTSADAPSTTLIRSSDTPDVTHWTTVPTVCNTSPVADGVCPKRHDRQTGPGPDVDRDQASTLTGRGLFSYTGTTIRCRGGPVSQSLLVWIVLALAAVALVLYIVRR